MTPMSRCLRSQLMWAEISLTFQRMPSMQMATMISSVWRMDHPSLPAIRTSKDGTIAGLCAKTESGSLFVFLDRVASATLIFFGIQLRPRIRTGRATKGPKEIMNIEKITQDVPIFGTSGPNARQHRRVKDLSSLMNEGVNFNTYTIREGEILRFPKFEDLEVEWVAVRKGSENGYHIVKCESEYHGIKKITWFGLPALYKRQVVGEDENVPVNPTWYELGNNLERLKALSKMEEIEGLETVKIMVPAFDGNGNRIYETVLDDAGNPVVKDGKVVQKGAVKPQSVVLISEYVSE